jgi:hypothetical protein
MVGKFHEEGVEYLCKTILGAELKIPDSEPSLNIAKMLSTKAYMFLTGVGIDPTSELVGRLFDRGARFYREDRNGGLLYYQWGEMGLHPGSRI